MTNLSDAIEDQLNQEIDAISETLTQSHKKIEYLLKRLAKHFDEQILKAKISLGFQRYSDESSKGKSIQKHIDELTRKVDELGPVRSYTPPSHGYESQLSSFAGTCEQLSNYSNFLLKEYRHSPEQSFTDLEFETGGFRLNTAREITSDEKYLEQLNRCKATLDLQAKRIEALQKLCREPKSLSLILFELKQIVDSASHPAFTEFHSQLSIDALDKDMLPFCTMAHEQLKTLMADSTLKTHTNPFKIISQLTDVLHDYEERFKEASSFKRKKATPQRSLLFTTPAKTAVCRPADPEQKLEDLIAAAARVAPLFWSTHSGAPTRCSPEAERKSPVPEEFQTPERSFVGVLTY